MKLIEDVSVRLSQAKFRKYYLMFFSFFILLIVIPFLPGWMNYGLEYDVTDILDYVEMFFVLATLLYLYMNTNKGELNRYKENYKFYKQRYKGEELLILESGSNSVHSSSINYGDIDIFENGPKRLLDIDFILGEGEYSLPLLIQESARDILVNKFNVQSKADYNGLTLSLNNIVALPGGRLSMNFCRSSYYDYLLTNMIPEYEIISGLTVRDYLEASGKKTLNDLNVSLAENHLGISCLVTIPIEEDGFENNYLIIPKRSMDTTVFKGQLAPSVSGAANIDTCSKDGEVSLANFFCQEIDEEISPFLIKAYCDESYKLFKPSFLKDAVLVGISRELKRLGKPELFFSFSFKQVLKINSLEKNGLNVIPKSGYYEVSVKKSEVGGIDFSECDSYFLVKREFFMQNLKEYTKEKARSKSSFNNEEIYTVFTDENIKVSESLLVNVIYSNSVDHQVVSNG
jgi:hypothetical protein